MELAEATMWAIVVALIAIPLLYYFWRRWDRPSRAAKAEQDRRLQERETREVFQKEEAKVREHERQQALVQLQERKKVDALSPSKAAMDFALSSLDNKQGASITQAENGESVDEVTRSQEEIDLLEQIPESIEVPDIEPDESVSDILEDEGPISLKVGIALPEEVKTEVEPESIEEEIEWPEWD
ncbi:MAG: hypothetical protein HOE69_03005 [Euryarchaeota archaeon]|jgi:hypothetical protein|nr:hypothetical protein [Euryarchaeota archaeon]